jgi:hypothetical protein
MAGQRGSSQNAGLIARQAAQQGAATQQNAVGQAATLSAQQQLAQEGMLQSQQNQLVGQQVGAVGSNTTAANNEQQNLLNAQGAFNNAAVGSQSSVNNANAALAGINMQGQQNLIGGLMNGSAVGGSGIAGMFADGGAVDNVEPNTSNVETQGTPSVPPTNIPTIGNAFSSGGGGGSSGGGLLSLVALLAEGGTIQPMGRLQPVEPKGPQSSLGQMLSSNPGGVSTEGPGAIAAVSVPTIANAFSSKGGSSSQDASPSEGGGGNSQTQHMAAAKGGPVKAMLSPGERYLPPAEVDKVKKGEKEPMKAGVKVPGKPKVGGAKDDYANDIIPADLEEGGLVLPRSVTQSKHPEWAAHKFVAAHMAKGGMLPTKGKKAKK